MWAQLFDRVLHTSLESGLRGDGKSDSNNLRVSLVNQVHSSREDLPSRQWISCMILLSSYSTWIAIGERKANQNYRLIEVGNTARASWHDATWFQVKEHQPSETLEFFQSRIFIASSFLWSFPEPDLAINLQAGFGFWCLCEMFQHLLPGTHPFSPWCEGLWVQGAALLEGLQCLGTTGEPPSSWASLNRWDILSWQCSTAHQQLRVWSKAASGPGEGSVRSCFGV